jgi:quercetin dioxygenase-like cupin family protein
MSADAPTHQLALHRHDLDDGPATLPAATRVLYVVEGTVALSSPGGRWPDRLDADAAAWDTSDVEVAPVDGHAVVLAFELLPADGAADGAELVADLHLDTSVDHLLRCDRVDFPPGGVALLHTHQGPGTRCLLRGSLRVEVDGRSTTMVPLGSWFERGPDPVYATASATEPTAFVRVMVLPRTLLGTPSIRYVREEDRDAPKSQRYTIFVDDPVELPGGTRP